MSSKIILEGVDGSGKSTVSRILQEEGLKKGIEYEIFHCTRHTPNNLEFFLDKLSSDKNIIFDRFHVGQFIYQNSSDRKENRWLSLLDLEVLELVIKKINARVIYVESDLKACLANCMKDTEDNYYTLDYLKDLDTKYRFFFDNISSLDVEYYTNKYESKSDIRTNRVDYSSLPKIVAVDFDGCLNSCLFPEIGKLDRKLVQSLTDGKFKDYKKVLWTSRDGKALADAVEKCREEGLVFDAVNRNIDEVLYMTGNDTRKVYADVYIDDKAVRYKSIQGDLNE